MMSRYTHHPAANLFPLMDEKALTDLARDIKDHGLQDPIILCDGMILDGRNRLNACTLAGVKPRFEQFTGASPVQFVWSKNGHRRHMTKSQLAMVAVSMLPMLEEEARKRQLSTLNKGSCSVTAKVPERGKGEATEQAGAIVGVSATLVKRAKRLKRERPDLAEEVLSGSRTLGRHLSSKVQCGRQDKETRAADIKRLASEGYLPSQIAEKLGIGEKRVRWIAKEMEITLADAVIKRRHNIQPRRVIEETINGISGYTIGLQAINGADLDFTPEEAGDLARSLRGGVRTLTKLCRRLEDISNAK